MLPIRSAVSRRAARIRVRRYHSPSSDWPQPVPVLANASPEAFREDAFHPGVPALLPRGHFLDAMPAIKKWFQPMPGHNSTGPASDDLEPMMLNIEHFKPYADIVVPIEITRDNGFARVHEPLDFFLRAERHERTYLAQAPLDELPAALRADVPTPTLVTEAGKGDVYASALWLGFAPTDTPLHRDPNPNLFVQLAGQKKVRIFPPKRGAAIYEDVQARAGAMAATAGAMRGEEMMAGPERVALNEAVWPAGEDVQVQEKLRLCYEAVVAAGDALFIPKGWWHSVRSLGVGMTGSVNWWFR